MDRDQRTMLRGAPQRQQRASMDTGTGEKRLAGGRGQHASRGQFMNFYEDLGFSSTAEGAKQIRADEASFQSKMKAEGAKVSSAQKDYEKAMAEFDIAKGKVPSSVGAALDSAYSKYKQSYVPINVVDPSGTKIEATYKLPKQVAENLAKEKGFVSAWVNDGKAFNISTRTKEGAIRGQELHEGLNDAIQGVKDQFYQANTGAIAKELGYAQRSIAEAEANLSARGAEINAARSMLAGTQKQRDQMWSDLRGDYQKKLDTMEAIFGGFNVKGKGEE